jgi:hypothetical protein
LASEADRDLGNEIKFYSMAEKCFAKCVYLGIINLLIFNHVVNFKVSSISRQVHIAQGKRKKLIKFAGRWLQFKRDTGPTQLKNLEPPSEFLEEDATTGADDQRVPLDALYILQSIR